MSHDPTLRSRIPMSPGRQPQQVLQILPAAPARSSHARSSARVSAQAPHLARAWAWNHSHFMGNSLNSWGKLWSLNKMKHNFPTLDFRGIWVLKNLRLGVKKTVDEHEYPQCQVTSARETLHCSWWATAKAARNVPCHRQRCPTDRSVKGDFMLILWWFGDDLFCHPMSSSWSISGEVLEAKSVAYQRAYERPGRWWNRCVTQKGTTLLDIFWGSKWLKNPVGFLKNASVRMIMYEK